MFSFEGADGVAPTIRVNPGDAIDLTLNNRLPKRSDVPNDVNIHFHGLRVSPNAPGDDVMMTLAHPGESLHYFVHLPKNQEPGLYWYHPHAHGQTYWQIANGMSGAIVVEGIQHRIPALGRMRERVIVLREVLDDPDIMTIPIAARPDPIRRAVLAARRRAGRTGIIDDDDAVGQPCAAKGGMHVTVNGQTRETIGIDPGERQFFRVVNATAGRYFDLAVDGEPLRLVGLDGVPLNAYPGSSAVETVRHVLLAPAARAEFVVTGSQHGTELRTNCYNAGESGDRDPAAVLADLRPDGRGPHLPSALTIRSTATLRDTSLPAPRARHTLRFTEDSNGFYINGKAFDMEAPPAIVAHSGTLEEWTIVNDTDEVHDFHIHQIHFAVEAIDGRPVSPRHWVDTITVAPRTFAAQGTSKPGAVKLLMDFRDPIVRGTFVYHCHILDHEDGGMMAKIQVQ